MNLLKRIYRWIAPKKLPIITYTHFYENARKEVVLCIIIKTGRGVVYVLNENHVEVKLKSHQIEKIPKYA